MPATVVIITGKSERRISVPVGTSLLDVLRSAGISMRTPCGGMGICGGCKVAASGELAPPDEHEAAFLAERDMRLACRTKVEGDCIIRPPDSLFSAHETIYAAPTGKIPGAAVDIGTTFISARLYDTTSGLLLGEASAPDVLMTYGEDIIARAGAAGKQSRLADMTNELRGQVFSMIIRLCEKTGTLPSALSRMTIAGNSVMQRIFRGIVPLGGEIFPAVMIPAGKLNFKLFPDAEVYILPELAGHIGGDAAAAILMCGLTETDGSLLIDLGTNGELALSANGRIYICSTAAGPAFEGRGISCGKPGGELVDLLAEMLDSGAVDKTGRLLPADEAPVSARSYIGRAHGEDTFFISPDVFITAREVRTLLLAKAAVCAGIKMLIKAAGLCEKDINTLHIAGGLGNALNIDNARRIGLIPCGLDCAVSMAGNAALCGTSLALMSAENRAKLEELPARCVHIELAGNVEFADIYVDEMRF